MTISALPPAPWQHPDSELSESWKKWNSEVAKELNERKAPESGEAAIQYAEATLRLAVQNEKKAEGWRKECERALCETLRVHDPNALRQMELDYGS